MLLLQRKQTKDYDRDSSQYMKAAASQGWWKPDVSMY